METKSTVVKSKSSNSGISKLREERKTQSHKKSRSNAEFPAHGIKKRGVYVEKRLTKPNLANDKKEDALTKKPPSRPRPGQKKFVASVLTILSKSTTGTQYPEVKPGAKEYEEKEITYNVKLVSSSNKDRQTKNSYKKSKVYNEENNINLASHNKEKFRSRVLRKKFVREDKKKMVVLQSKREIAQTPSNYSDWSYKDASQRSNTSTYVNDALDKDIENSPNIANDLKNAILEGRSTKKVKKLRYFEEEPMTLVSDAPKEKNLYNFFVDLLETTISVYNVAAEYDAKDPSETSKIELKINESVANKLNIDKYTTNKSTTEFNENIQYLENQIDGGDDYVNKTTQPFVVKQSREDLRLRSGKPKLKANSFTYHNKINTQPKKSKSVEINRRTTFRNKNDIINVLKQELEEDAHFIEEPKSIFQALRIMARNKKRISFDPKTFTDECVLQRRKVISSRKRKESGKKAKNKNDPISNFFKPVSLVHVDNDYKFRPRTKYGDLNKKLKKLESMESYPSLEVYGIDYETAKETPKVNRPYFTKPEDITLTYHSSNSDLDFDVNDAILNPTSTYSSLRKFYGF